MSCELNKKHASFTKSVCNVRKDLILPMKQGAGETNTFPPENRIPLNLLGLQNPKDSSVASPSVLALHIFSRLRFHHLGVIKS